MVLIKNPLDKALIMPKTSISILGEIHYKKTTLQERGSVIK